MLSLGDMVSESVGRIEFKKLCWNFRLWLYLKSETSEVLYHHTLINKHQYRLIIQDNLKLLRIETFSFDQEPS